MQLLEEQKKRIEENFGSEYIRFLSPDYFSVDSADPYECSISTLYLNGAEYLLGFNRDLKKKVEFFMLLEPEAFPRFERSKIPQVFAQKKNSTQTNIALDFPIFFTTI